MALENDPYRNPYFRPHRDRELDGFRYADGSLVRWGHAVSVGEGIGTVIAFDSCRMMVQVLFADGPRWVRPDDMRR